MNLHGIVSAAVATVNPRRLGQIFISTGATQVNSGKRTPTYADPITLPMQVQALETRDLQQLDGLNKSGSTHKIYVSGSLQGLVRVNNSGGDLIKLLTGENAGRTFLVTAVLEDWPDWTCVSVTLQNDP